jgi:prevent-host-death family protein
MALEYTTIPTTELRKHGSEIVNRVAYGDEELVLTRHGKPIAALVSLTTLGRCTGSKDAHYPAEAAKAKEGMPERIVLRKKDVVHA